MAEFEQAHVAAHCEPKPLSSTAYFNTVNGSLILWRVRIQKTGRGIVARAPRQVATDVQAFAFHVQEHVFVEKPSRRVRVGEQPAASM